MPDKPRLALFDIDGTIFRSSLLIEATNMFVKKGIFPKKVLRLVEPAYQRWLNRSGDYETYLSELVKSSHYYNIGCKETDIKRAVRELLHQHRNRVYRYTRDQINELKGYGYKLIAISGSPEYIVSEFAMAWGFDAAFGRVMEVANGVYTGRFHTGSRFVPHDIRQDKARILRSYLKTKNLSDDLSDCYAFGDTEGDVPMLELVGHPIAFNPNGVLHDIAVARGWQEVVERKNVVYVMKNFQVLEVKSY